MRGASEAGGVFAMSSSLSSLPAAASPMLRAFDPLIDGKPIVSDALRYRIISGERICGWSCDPLSPHYEADKHLCPKECKAGGRLRLPREGADRGEGREGLCEDGRRRVRHRRVD